MKNIKVNIVNPYGKKTSTTINANIAVCYYRFCVEQASKEYIRTIEDAMAQSKEAVSLRNKCIQDYVNKLIEEVTAEGNPFQMKGVDQQMIEMRLLNAIKYSN